MEDIILVGYGGHAKSVADSIERQGQFNIIGYTDLEKHDSQYEYLGTDEVLQSYFNRGTKNAAICIGYLGKGELRQKIYNKLKNIGFSFPIIIDPSAIVSDNSQIGEGTFIGKGAIVNAEASVGKMSIINTMSIIEHDCIIGNFAHVSVSAVICGQAQVGDAAFIGANSTVIQCRKVLEKQIVPAGAVIRNTEDIASKKERR